MASSDTEQPVYSTASSMDDPTIESLASFSSKILGVMAGSLDVDSKVRNTTKYSLRAIFDVSLQLQLVNHELPELVFALLSAPSGPEPVAVTITGFMADVLKVGSSSNLVNTPTLGTSRL